MLAGAERLTLTYANRNGVQPIESVDYYNPSSRIAPLGGREHGNR